MLEWLATVQIIHKIRVGNLVELSRNVYKWFYIYYIIIKNSNNNYLKYLVLNLSKIIAFLGIRNQLGLKQTPSVITTLPFGERGVNFAL